MHGSSRSPSLLQQHQPSGSAQHSPVMASCLVPLRCQRTRQPLHAGRFPRAQIRVESGQACPRPPPACGTTVPFFQHEFGFAAD